MDINLAEALAEVTALSDLYEAALTDNNDELVLGASFWDSPLTIRYGMGENLYGSTAIAAFRRGQTSGSTKQVRKKVITTFGRDAATVNIEFERPGMAGIGRQSQTWIRFTEGWRIVAAHVSTMKPAS